MRLASSFLTILLTPLAVTGMAGSSVDRDHRSALCGSTMAELASLRNALDAPSRTRRKEMAQGLLLAKGANVAFCGSTRSRVGLSQAVGAWNAALGGAVLRSLPADSDANIRVRLVPSISDGDDVQGEVMTDGGMGFGGTVSAEVLVRDNVDGRRLTDREVGSVIVHELGHLLGLDDSVTGDGLMGEFDEHALVTQPTQEEIDAVRLIRLQAAHDLS